MSSDQATGRGYPSAGARKATWLAALGACLLAATTQACTTFHPLPDDPIPGERIRARLTATGQVRQASVTGVGRTDLEGNLIALEPDAFVMRVPISGIDPALHRSSKMADTLRVLRSDVTGIDIQRFSVTRTAFLVGGITATAAIGLLLADHIGAAQGTEDGPGHRTALHRFMPWIRIPVG